MIKLMVLMFAFMLLAGILCYLFEVNPWPLSQSHPGMPGWILVLISQFYTILGLILGQHFGAMIYGLQKR